MFLSLISDIIFLRIFFRNENQSNCKKVRRPGNSQGTNYRASQANSITKSHWKIEKLVQIDLNQGNIPKIIIILHVTILILDNV